LGFGRKEILGAQGMASMAGLAWAGLSVATLATLAAENVVPVLL